MDVTKLPGMYLQGKETYLRHAHSMIDDPTHAAARPATVDGWSDCIFLSLFGLLCYNQVNQVPKRRTQTLTLTYLFMFPAFGLILG